MTVIGVDLEQYFADPQSSGIQRVLQHLAREWPVDLAQAYFVLPRDQGYLVLSSSQADSFVSLAFETQDGTELRDQVAGFVELHASNNEILDEAQLIEEIDAWLLPEVSYLPGVLRRFERITLGIPGAMIGYDIMPMSEPANYRLIPGTDGYASEYFRLLATAGSVVCISEHSRREIIDRLRRDPNLPISVAHPGGDHVGGVADSFTQADRKSEAGRPVRFLRLGTLENRKMPREIIAGFQEARRRGAQAELVFVGRPSASSDTINQAVREAVNERIGITWVADATDHEVLEWVRNSDVFLSVGVEGYGIPVLEALQLHTPVLFGGVQPAAELMEGRGCDRIRDVTVEGLSDVFTHYSDRKRAADLASTVTKAAIPTWQEFARGVVQGVLRA